MVPMASASGGGVVAASLNLVSVTSALGAAQAEFEKRSGKKGTLTMREASDLLNRQDPSSICPPVVQ